MTPQERAEEERVALSSRRMAGMVLLLLLVVLVALGGAALGVVGARMGHGQIGPPSASPTGQVAQVATGCPGYVGGMP